MRTRLLVSMGVLIISLTGCREGPVDSGDLADTFGGVNGVVTVEGDPLAAVTVTLAGPASRSTQTESDGTFEFLDLPLGTYAVSLSGFPADVRFETTAKSVTVMSDATVPVPFEGTWVRNAGIRGTVTVDGSPLADATLELSGAGAPTDATATTDGNGEYAFEGLLPGSYEVTITGVPDEVVFDPLSQAVAPGRGETVSADFAGYRAIGEISGQVGVANDEPLAGVRVVITHLGTGEGYETVTGSDGAYLFEDLRLGMWDVRITGGWDESLIVFDETADELELTVADPDQVRVFRGRYRPGSVTGTVLLDGAPAGGVTVSLVDIAGGGGNAVTDGTGSYSFAEVAPGSATVTVEGGDRTCEDNPRAVDVPPATEVVADFTCVTSAPPDLTFELTEAEGPDEMLSSGATIRIPLRDDAWMDVGEVEVTTGMGGFYYRASDRLYADAPGYLTFRYALTAYALNLYALAALDLLEVSGIGASCALQLALLDPSGAVLTAITIATLTQSLAIELVPGAVQLQLAFLALTTGGCDGAYVGVGSGGLRAES